MLIVYWAFDHEGPFQVAHSNTLPLGCTVTELFQDGGRVLAIMRPWLYLWMEVSHKPAVNRLWGKHIILMVHDCIKFSQVDEQKAERGLKQ